MASEPLALLSARLQQSALAFHHMDTSSKIELFSLISFGCCLVGAFSQYTVTVNLALALLGLLACRGSSDVQLMAFCLFAVFTTVTDVSSAPTPDVSSEVSPDVSSAWKMESRATLLGFPSDSGGVPVHGRERVERPLDLAQRDHETRRRGQRIPHVPRLLSADRRRPASDGDGERRGRELPGLSGPRLARRGCHRRCYG